MRLDARISERPKASEGGIVRSLLIAAAIFLASPDDLQARHSGGLFETVEPVPLPSPPGAHEPSLVSHDGKLYLGWMEQAGRMTNVRMSVLAAQRWSQPRLVHSASDLFVNWADFPELAVFEDGTIAVHWLREIGPFGYDYGVEIALSHDGGATWSQPLVPHDDMSLTQHGFVSMLPSGSGTLAVVWLDGRAYDQSEAMQLRATSLTSDGQRGREVAVDLQTCSCCQTSLASTEQGTILAAYRDRTEGEIRDIAVARLTAVGWSDPVVVHADGWELSGCPVNGPAIASHDRTTAVAWFTGANDVPAVKVAFSDDDGRSFGAPFRIDHGDPVGRVDAEMFDDGTALVTWVEWTGDSEALILCWVDVRRGCIDEARLATNSIGATVNFPQMARLDRDVYVAWTEPTESGDGLAMRRIRLSGHE